MTAVATAPETLTEANLLLWENFIVHTDTNTLHTVACKRCPLGVCTTPTVETMNQPTTPCACMKPGTAASRRWDAIANMVKEAGL